jgi:SPP1 gp7 family putative phage head morphogenesis protein
MGHDIKDLQKRISGEISRGLSSGQMYSEITRNIASWARIPKNNAVRIARTEAHRIQTKASMNACNKAKTKGADVVKQWDASLDKRTRDSHARVDGEIRELDEKFSNGLMYPGDPNGAAEEVINCRCALLQRARWALGNDYTKWSEDAPVVIADDGTTQFAIIEAKNFKDFQKQYKQATERVRLGVQKIKPLENNEKSSTISSGAVSGARNPLGKKAKEHANRYYGLVRSMKTDVAKISKATGISEEDVQSVKNFIFLDKHDLGGKELEYFEPDYMMAESWQRLVEGKPEKHDITLLKHEIMEKRLMEEGLSQEEAHLRTSQKYNYSKEAGEYYAKVEKYKKE